MTTTEPSRTDLFDSDRGRGEPAGAEPAGADVFGTELFGPDRTVELLDRQVFGTEPDTVTPVSSRRALREQIDSLEQRLSALLSEAHCVETTEASRDRRAPVAAGPRLLSLGELEATRDALAARIEAVRVARRARDERVRRNRALLIEIFEDPGAHPGVILTKADLGELGCKRWRVAPMLGPVGRMMGWWRVVVSSGCP